MISLKRMLGFLAIFFCVGFVFGTLTLVYIVEGFTTYSRTTGWLSNYENAVVIVIIIAYVLYSFVFSKWLHSTLSKLSTFTQIICGLMLTLAMAACLWYWFNPSSHRSNGILKSADGRFQTGPYPDKAKMMALKEQNYTAIITLLSPYVVPFEPVLLDKEIANAKEVGIPVIQIPMLPWVSDNTESIAKIEELAKEKNNNKYYVHCYYGRDRAYMFMRIINKYSPVPAIINKSSQTGSNEKSIEFVDFENGPAVVVGKHVLFAPSPTLEEFAAYVVKHKPQIFNSPMTHAYSLHASTVAPTTEEESLKKYGIQFSSSTVHDFPYNPEGILEFARQLKTISGSVIVYSFYTRANPRPVTLDGIILSYITDLPTVPRNLFTQSPMQNGKTIVIAPNIVLGPQPTEDEVENYLYNTGIRKFAYIGNCMDKKLKYAKEDALEAKFTFDCFDSKDTNLPKTISKGGPWYVYGPQLEAITPTLTNYFKNSIPDLTPKAFINVTNGDTNQ